MDHWLYFRVRVLLLLQSVNTLESSSNLVRGADNVDDWVCSERSGVAVAVFAIIRMRVRWPEGVGAPLISDFAKIYWWYATVMSGLRFGGCMRDAVEKLGTFAGCVRLCMGRVVGGNGYEFSFSFSFSQSSHLTRTPIKSVKRRIHSRRLPCMMIVDDERYMKYN